MRLSVFVLAGWFACGVLLPVSTGCSSRSETPVVEPDSTIAFPAKKPGGLNAAITLCSKIGKRTGRPYGIRTVFTIEPEAKVQALVALENVFALGRRPLLVHLVWLDPNDETIFKKQLEVVPEDPPAPLQSGISIPPSKRSPGTYKFQVYLFRELIAEKAFELRPRA